VALRQVAFVRLKSEVWVKAYLRRCMGEGSSAVVVRHGDDDAGAIFIKVARLDRTADLFGPAPAGFAGDDGERRWTCIAGPAADESAVDATLEREHRLDRDIWVVEVEDRGGRHFLDDWLMAD
jgi:hypothetical protein